MRNKVKIESINTSQGVVDTMINIKLNDILRIGEEEIFNSKIELNMQAGAKEKAYIDLLKNK